MDIVASLNADTSVKKWFWIKWLFAIAGISIIFAATLDIAPFLHKDEFMIVDLGRIILHPHTDWSITWMSDINEPVLFWSYIGPVIQEFSFQLLGQYGPRISALLGALVAATVVVRWLLAKGTTRNVSFLLGLVFLLDPLFVQAYTMGRVDGWTIALCLTSCWLLVDVKNRLPGNHNIKKRLALAGALAAISFFVWPSAVFLFPLIVVELYSLVRSYKYIDDDWKKSASLIAWFMIGGFTTALLVILPILPRLYEQFNIVMEGLKINSYSDALVREKSQYVKTVSSLMELFRILKFTGVLALMGLVAMIWKRKTGLLLALLFAIFIMIYTLVYIHRVQYLLPYFIAAVAGIYHNKYRAGNKSFTSLFKDGRLALLLIWSLGLSLCARSILAFDGVTNKSRQLVYQAAKSMIGKGNYTVFSTYEFYYAGRSLGWKMYSPYLAVGEPQTPKKLQEILPHVDYAIMHLSEVTGEFINKLHKEDMQNGGSYFVYTTPAESFDGITTNIVRLRNLYSIFRKPYGPYSLYKRKPNQVVAAKRN